jgi:hypothetical protein
MEGEVGAADLEYTVRRAPSPTGELQFERTGQAPVTASDEGELLALLDADLVVEAQRRRPDLYVVHAAVLEYRETAVMLVAKSGEGKSTLAWGMLHHGFRYLSDELGPVALDRLEVHPYPRALMMKDAPPATYPAPPATLQTSRGFHVPIQALPGGGCLRPTPLGAVFFLRYDPWVGPSVRPLTPAEGATRLYANTLNPLAHAGDGIDGAIRIATARPGFELVTSDLASTCALVTATLEVEPRRRT